MKETTNDDLARMIAKGFDEVHDKIGGVNRKIDKLAIDNQKDHLAFKKQLAQHDFNMTEMVHKADYYKLEERVYNLEAKMKVV